MESSSSVYEGTIERHHRPDDASREADAKEGPADLRGHARPLRAPRLGRALAALGQTQDERRRDERAGERNEVAEPRRIERPYREHTRDERPERAPARLRETGAERRPPAASVRVELDERRRRGAADHPDGEPLQRSGAVQPRLALRGREQDQPAARGPEPGENDGPAAEAVGDAPEQDQGGHEHERVGGEDRRQHEVREGELRRVDRVERRRQVGAGHQDEPARPDDQERPEAARSLASPGRVRPPSWDPNRHHRELPRPAASQTREPRVVLGQPARCFGSPPPYPSTASSRLNSAPKRRWSGGATS